VSGSARESDPPATQRARVEPQLTSDGHLREALLAQFLRFPVACQTAMAPLLLHLLGTGRLLWGFDSSRSVSPSGPQNAVRLSRSHRLGGSPQCRRLSFHHPL
jgi:hypothetical protein